MDTLEELLADESMDTRRIQCLSPFLRGKSLATTSQRQFVQSLARSCLEYKIQDGSRHLKILDDQFTVRPVEFLRKAMDELSITLKW